MNSPQNKTDVTRYVSLNTYAANRAVRGRIVTVLDSTHESRGLKLISSYSRALPKHSIHELIATDQTDRKPGDTADRIAYLAFFEVELGGCILVGEMLEVDGQPIGTILGFDETHEPNHMNIVIGVNARQTGRQLNFAIGKELRFEATSKA